MESNVCDYEVAPLVKVLVEFELNVVTCCACLVSAESQDL